MRIPSAGTPIGIKDLLTAFLSGGRGRQTLSVLEDVLKEMLKVKHCFLVSSGTTAFYVILKTLIKNQKSKVKNQTEIILPAYTAPSLILPIKRLGLSYRLVDVSLETFNMDEELVINAIGQETLAVLPVYLFGLPCPIERLIGLKKEMGFYLIEDAASSFGTKDGNGFHTGTRGDIGFLSFNRGKNISTIRGGSIITNDDTLAIEIKREVDTLSEPDSIKKLKIYIEGIGLSLAVRPWFYTLFYPFVSCFKSTDLHEDFESFKYTSFQNALGVSLFEKAETIFHDRNNKGHFLYGALKGIPGIMLPYIPNHSRVVFNQFPIIVDDPSKKDILLKKIIEAGVEATTLYDKPIHKIYKDDFRGSDDPYPNATYMAERLLLIPTHPYINKKDLKKVIEIIHRELGS